MKSYHFEEKPTAKEIPNQVTNQQANQPSNSKEKRLICPQLPKNFSTLCRTQRLINCSHDSLPLMPIMRQVNSSMPSQSISLRSILILSSHKCLFYHCNNILCRAQIMKLLIMKSPQLPIQSRFLVPKTVPSTLFSTHSVLMRGQWKRVGLKNNLKFNHIKMDLKMQAGLKLRRSNDEHL
jgi:hypothetical protein